jgi:hypothetical protein
MTGKRKEKRLRSPNEVKWPDLNNTGLKTSETLRAVIRSEARRASLSRDPHVGRLGDLLDILLDDLELLIAQRKLEAA